MKLFTVIGTVTNVQLHTAECHTSNLCCCGPSYTDMVKGETFAVFHKICYEKSAETKEEKEEFEGVYSFLALIHGRLCSIVPVAEHLRIREFRCSPPTEASSSERSL